MNITILGQGYEPISANSVGNYLIKFLADTEFYSFTGISAFTSQSAINGLSKHLIAAKKHLKLITIVTGVDKEVTSEETLNELLDLRINAYVFYQPLNTIFHPKIYLFEGIDKSELIIGSSNLTSQGLFTNVEASILISIDNSIEADRKIIEQLKDYFKGIFDFTDPNLKELSKEIIANLVKTNVVPTEAEQKIAQGKAEKEEILGAKRIISQIFPKRELAKIPAEFRSRSKPKAIKQEIEAIIVRSNPSKLLWTSGPLSQRDLNIPQGLNTNPTGSMLFKKGNTDGIDQRHYFRDEVFSDLIWIKDTKTTHLEKTSALFKIIIDGIDYGGFDLIITHNPRTDIRSYEQKNSMTSISWGSAKTVIAKENLIGKSANLYRNDKNGEFTLEIK